ncbi:cyclic lactone autoinducer peptide [Alkaliphilus hydrothermalis]|uniref:Cyclic lactone autoinducer peptide n=1 Tax=Alkaliphilus hydrothermalis TaxID=1482730 RepID=A0ABS2NRP4_9FIRM|nr:cyclic lactone autoinducer peptide [Alkaliphilus hydrothermalis]MBM7615501.1 cyclic lactone autoinducer peptide [Alkaliphilus hydrothermalis]
MKMTLGLLTVVASAASQIAKISIGTNCFMFFYQPKAPSK